LSEKYGAGNAIGYAKFLSRSHHPVIRVYDAAGQRETYLRPPQPWLSLRLVESGRMSQATIIVNIFSVFAAAGIGAFLGAYLAHHFTEQRDRYNRKLNFLSFMGGFRSEAERTYPPKFGDLFPVRVHEFRREAAKIRSDLTAEQQAGFDEAVNALCQLTDSQVTEVGSNQNYLGRTRVTEAIDKVKRFLD
jgi:hypothetical protein